MALERDIAASRSRRAVSTGTGSSRTSQPCTATPTSAWFPSVVRRGVLDGLSRSSGVRPAGRRHRPGGPSEVIADGETGRDRPAEGSGRAPRRARSVSMTTPALRRQHGRRRARAGACAISQGGVRRTDPSRCARSPCRRQAPASGDGGAGRSRAKSGSPCGQRFFAVRLPSNRFFGERPPGCSAGRRDALSASLPPAASSWCDVASRRCRSAGTRTWRPTAWLTPVAEAIRLPVRRDSVESPVCMITARLNSGSIGSGFAGRR